MRLLDQIRSPILTLAFSPDGRTLSAAVRGWMRVGQWRLPDGQFRPWHPHADTWVRSLAHSPDGRCLAVGNDWGMVLPFLRDQDRYENQFHVAGAVRALAYAPHQPVLAVAARGITLFSENEGGPDLLLPKSDCAYHAVAFSPDGLSLAACPLARKRVVLWRMNEQWKLLQIDSIDLPHTPTSMAFAPDSTTLAIASHRILDFHDLATGEQRKVCTEHEGRIQHLAYNRSGSLLATASADGTVCLRNPRNGQPIVSYDWGIGSLRCVAFAPDGMTCAAGSERGQVMLWDLDD
jgi:WD40 repeat protein